MRTMINILPASYRRQQLLLMRAVQWTTIISAVLISGWVWHWLEMREHKQLTQRLDVLSREHAPTQTMLRQVVDMRRQLKDLEQQEAVAKELETQRNALTLLGVVSEAAQKSKGRLRITKMELSNFQAIGKKEGDGPGAAPAGLLLTGIAMDNSAVVDMFDRLQHAGIFSHVELLNIVERKGNSSGLRDYEVRCEF